MPITASSKLERKRSSLSREQAEDQQPGRVEPQQVDHPPVPLRPALVGKGLALRQEVAQMAHDPPSADVRLRLT
jgi:hypothetical protein